MIKKILHFLVRLLLILLLMALVLGSILLYNLQMNKSFITTFYTVTVDKPVEDLRIVLLSDLHLSEYGTDNADLVQKVRNLAPDLIAVAGDMDIDTNPDYSLVLSLMRQLVDIAPEELRQRLEYGKIYRCIMPPATTSGRPATPTDAIPFLTTSRPPASTG